MVVVPAAVAVARPVLLLIFAIDVLDELQVTDVVISWAVPSKNVPVAVNCREAPTDTIGLAGVTVMEVRGEEITVTVVLPRILPEVAVMVAVPPATAVARPVLVTVATDKLDELQVTEEVITLVVPSENVPVAVNCWVPPRDMVGLAGVTATEDRVAEVTVRAVLPEIVPEVALMVELPPAMAAARPLLLMEATDVFDELQVTDVLISWVVPSENVPLAVNCWVAATDILGFAGVTEMEDRVAVLTVRTVLPETVPEVAVMVELPAPMTVARPLLLMVATDVVEEFQVTCAVISWVVPSENVPVAVNCWVTPPGMIGLAGVTAMEDKVPEVTVRVALPEIVPEVAVMVAVPAAMAVARPLLLMLATDVSEELQVTCPVISPLGPIENVPVAVNCWVAPTGRIGPFGVTVMAVGCAIPFPPPHVLKDTAKDPRNNIAAINPIFFMRTSSRKRTRRAL